MESTTINCAEACVNGCVLGDRCPNKQYAAQALTFMESTSLDEMHAIAEEALRKKMMQRMSEPPKWIIPD
ncbi:MAG TPA: hypothetical protein V6C58_27600 [Allocoleopsis sp.]